MKKRSRWAKNGERYSEPVVMALRAAFAEPLGFYKGARIKGQPLTPAQRQRAVYFKVKARAAL